MAAAIGQELEEEFLATIRKGQEIALDALKPLVEALHHVIPAMPVVRVAPAGRLPAARAVLAGGYEFAGHLLANQRQFADEVITATSRCGPARQNRKPLPQRPPRHAKRRAPGRPPRCPFYSSR